MTDIPAVVYLKPKNSLSDAEMSETEDACYKSTNACKIVKNHGNSVKTLPSNRKLLEALRTSVLQKIDRIDQKLDTLTENSNILEEKVDVLGTYFDGIHDAPELSTVNKISKKNRSAPVKKKITEIVLNSEEDFPKGSWLGFENNPEMRVRCCIAPKKLRVIDEICATPEKMALSLIDHLFDKEVQACSNISGLGKHRKKQLDPLLIYGIKCHLTNRFDITEEDWSKVKIHIDAKCRAAFRKKLKGTTIKSKKVWKKKTSSSNSKDIKSE